MQILAAIQSLSERMGRFEAERSSTPVSHETVSAQVSPFRREPFPDDDPDALSIYAPGSLTGSGQRSDQASARSATHEEETGSTLGVSAGDVLVSHVLIAAKIMSIRIPAPSPAPPGVSGMGCPRLALPLLSRKQRGTRGC